MNQVANTYAEAFFLLAKDVNKVEALKNDVKLVEASLNEVEGIKGFLSSIKVSKDDKKKVLHDIFKSKVDDLVINFLSLLVDKRRIVLYKDIFHAFYSLCNANLGIKEGVIEIARPISDEKLALLEKTLSHDGLKVELTTKINTTLISGFRIVFDDKVFDTSMKKKIGQMNEMLLRKDVSLWN